MSGFFKESPPPLLLDEKEMAMTASKIIQIDRCQNYKCNISEQFLRHNLLIVRRRKSMDCTAQCVLLINRSTNLLKSLSCKHLRSHYLASHSLRVRCDQYASWVFPIAKFDQNQVIYIALMRCFTCLLFCFTCFHSNDTVTDSRSHYIYVFWWNWNLSLIVNEMI